MFKNFKQNLFSNSIMEDNYDINMRNYFGFLFNFKRFFLPTTIMLPLMTISEIFQNDFYIFFSSFISLMIFGWNFPSISKLYYSKPIYFDDLDDNNENNKKHIHNRILYNIELSSKFKLKFIIFQQLIISLTLSIIIEYITIKYRTNKYNTMELLGLIGGLISLFAKVIRIVGKLFLSFLYYKKKKEKEELLERLNLNN